MKRIFLAAAMTLFGTSMASAEALVPAAVVFDEGSVEQSLTGVAGDAATGRDVFANRKLGNCLACHMNEDWSEQSFHGEVGPPLDGVAQRWSEAELRGIVTNVKMMFPDSIMPGFYVDSGFVRASDKFAGKTILNAQQVEDIVAYLQTLSDE
jgi:L-cysteine S-thiosulfotransferase